MNAELNSTSLVDAFENFTGDLVNDCFPEKVITITEFDKPYMTQELKQLRRKRQRVYRRAGKCDQYIALKKEFDSKLKREAEKYHIKILEEVSDGKRGNPYKALRKLELGYKECKNSFSLLEKQSLSCPIS